MTKRGYAIPISLVLAGCLAFGQGVPGKVAPQITMAEFVEILIPTLGLEANLPSNLKQLPSDRAFQVECALLSSHCLPYLGWANKDQNLPRNLLADVIFELVRRKLGVFAYDQPEKIRILAEQKILAPGGPNDPVSREEVLSVLKNPIITDAVVFFIGFPPCLATQKTDPVNDPFGAYRVKNVTEELPSPFDPMNKKPVNQK